MGEGRLPDPSGNLYLVSRGCAVRQEHHSRGLIDLKGAVPDRTRGFGHTAPTYVSRFPGSKLPRPSRLRLSGVACLTRSARLRVWSRRQVPPFRLTKAELRAAALPARAAFRPRSG